MSADNLQINKIALKNYDNKRLRSFKGITTFLYGTSAFKVCYEELMMRKLYAAYFDKLKRTKSIILMLIYNFYPFQKL